MEKPQIPNGHFPRLPWRLADDQEATIVDADGVPVAWGSSTTSVKAKHTDERGVSQIEYRTTETVSAIRARIIVEAVNFVHALNTQDMEKGS